MANCQNKRILKCTFKRRQAPMKFYRAPLALDHWYERLQAPAGAPPAGACVLALGAPIVLKITKISIFLKKNRQNVPSAIGADDRRLQAPTGVSTGADRRLSSAPTGVCSADRRLSLSLALGTSADRRQ